MIGSRVFAIESIYDAVRARWDLSLWEVRQYASPRLRTLSPAGLAPGQQSETVGDDRKFRK